MINRWGYFARLKRGGGGGLMCGHSPKREVGGLRCGSRQNIWVFTAAHTYTGHIIM